MKGERGTIELPVARDLHRRSRMTARRREGREARTDWRVKLRLGAFTLIEADLHTGRTHQIRVHFSALGCPVVGDTSTARHGRSAWTGSYFRNWTETFSMPRV
jgi:23S rRNA pseudouridine1911/1915/1917 synthase